MHLRDSAALPAKPCNGHCQRLLSRTPSCSQAFASASGFSVPANELCPTAPSPSRPLLCVLHHLPHMRSAETATSHGAAQGAGSCGESDTRAQPEQETLGEAVPAHPACGMGHLTVKLAGHIPPHGTFMGHPWGLCLDPCCPDHLPQQNSCMELCL